MRLPAFFLALLLVPFFSLGVAAPALAGCEDFGRTPRESFREINGRRGAFVAAVGRFSDGPVVDEIFALALDGSETSTRIVAAGFDGKLAAPEGFVSAFVAGLEVTQRCIGNDCHPRLDGTPYLVFIEKVRGRFKFAEDGCAVRAYANPSDATLNAVVSCLNGVCR